MKNPKKISVVVPVYFNEGSIAPLFKKIQEVELALFELNMHLELIFIDDGSGDNSFQELLKVKAIRNSTKIIKLTRNFGAVSASKCGFKFVSGDCFMILAADLQDPPNLILDMVKKWQAGAKFIICERISRDDPWSSKLYSALFYFILHKLVMSNYPSGGYDMALMDKSLLPHLINSSKNLYTPLLAYWLGFKPEIIQYHRAKREYGKSRWTFKKKIKAFLDIMLGFSVTPIRLISAVGLIVAISSFGYGLLITVNAFLGRIPVEGFASIVALITFLLGIIIIMLGIIGEYLWRIFDEVNCRPEVVVDEVF